jgi:superfamily II DNA or RNA helicase
MIKLTKQGYIIPKDMLTKKQLDKITDDLNMKPLVDERFKKVEEDGFNIYLETTNNKIILPRYYGLEKFGLPIDSNIKFKKLDNYDKIDIKFKGYLRDYQTEIINSILNEYCNDIDKPDETLKKYGGGIISIPPGKGKTVLAINLITKLKIRTLVIVHKTFLLNQWKERINQYTDATIGIIQQDNIDINNKDIVIGMLQSITQKDYDKELFTAFPLVIYDECHHLGAKIFSKSLIKVQAPYYLGLSATPDRKDKLETIFKYFLGDVKFKDTVKTNNNVIVKLYEYNNNDTTNFKTLYNKITKTYNAAKMITNLCKINRRNDLIIKIIIDILKDEPNRKILVLSGRCNSSKNEKSVNHIKILSDKLSEYEHLADKWGYYIGGMKQIKLEISSSKQIIIGTYEMAQEGLDISSLDTLILSTPLKGDIIQTCGRILRGNNVYTPMIIDIIDMIEPFNNQAKFRYGHYLLSKYDCKYYSIENNEIDNESKIISLSKLSIEPIFRKKKIETKLKIKSEINLDLFSD